MCEVSVSDAKSVLPWASLSAATDTGPGTSVDLEGVSNEFTIHVTTTGSPTSVSVSLEGSLDGANWYSIPRFLGGSNTYPGTTEVNPFGDVAGGSTPTAGRKPHARYVRASLTTLTGGASPTVTAYIAVGRVI